MKALAVIARDLIGIGGAASVAYGAWMVYAPAGFIIGGILALLAAMISARASK
jgi:hypothetical protein